MALTRSIDATMKNFSVSIDGQPLILDHIKQLNLQLGIGIIGQPGNITITFDLFKMLTTEGRNYNPVGAYIDIQIDDDKTGSRSYQGVITSFRKLSNVKQDLVMMTFDKENYLRLSQAVYWKTYKEVTIFEIFKDFCDQIGVPVNSQPANVEKRGTFWEYFAIPQNVPTLTYLLSEMQKDNFVIFGNPETDGLTVVSWEDMGRLDMVNQNNPDYVVDGTLAKFDSGKEQWKETTFIYSKQTDTRAPWNILEWDSTVTPHLQENSIHNNVFYSGLKIPLEHGVEDSELKHNDIGLTQAVIYSGRELMQSKIQPYPAVGRLVNNDETPASNTPDYDGVTNTAIHPRYMYYRMRDSYAQHLKWIKSSMTIPGSCKAVVPLSTMMVSFYENAKNSNDKEIAEPEKWQSGLYMISSSNIIISGNNIMCSYQLLKPRQ